MVSEEAAKAMARKIGALGYFETSAKTNTGVNEVFEEAAKLVFQSGPSESREGLCDCCLII